MTPGRDQFFSEQLGPIRLQHRLGMGGMADVWKGIHLQQDLAVAVKFLIGHRVGDEDFIRAFGNEVRTVAALDHPNIVMVFDHGEVPPLFAAMDDRFPAGCPYLVMEYASGDSIRRYQNELSWKQTSEILLSVLDSLAHAHARGVVHRDIKPANILVCTQDDARPGLKLTDFGVSYDSKEPVGADSAVSAGTPEYMAPEQFKCDWRAHGPWTDLYSLGCMAWELVCREHPFKGDFVGLATAHIYDPLPAFESVVEGVPRAFESWVRCMCAKEPSARFQCAADAAWALSSLIGDDQSEGPVFWASPADVKSSETASGLSISSYGYTLPQRSEISVEANSAPDPLLKGAKSFGRPSCPDDWRRDQCTTPMSLIGAGLGLYGLRSIPLVDRVSERDIIWSSLREARRESAVKLVLLEGASGTGKSRVADWMANRAHEVGAACVMRAVHGPTGGAGEGLAAMVRRHLRCVGLSRKGCLDQTQKLLTGLGAQEPDDWKTVVELMMPCADEAEGGVKLSSVVERHAVLRGLLELQSAERPLVVLLDDVQWSVDTLAFVEGMIGSNCAAPVLLLATLRSDLVGPDSLHSKILSRLEGQPGVRRVKVAALTEEDHSQLVHGLLRLEGELARRVVDRTEGNPLFAVQLVGDWVQRGVLEVGAEGFQLSEGDAADVPDDIHQMWTQRIEKLPLDMGSVSNAGRLALEIAAVLGQQVDSEEWQAVCEEAGVDVSADLLYHLFVNRLALPVEGGWRFVHGMLRESLVRIAVEHGRDQAHHGVCARGLEIFHGARNSRAIERVARHQFAAGRYEDAIDALMEAVRRLYLSDYHRAMELLGLRRQAMARVGADRDDARWAPALVFEAMVHRVRGNYQAAEETIETAARVAKLAGDKPLISKAVCVWGHVSADQGDLDGAMRTFAQARDFSKSVGDIPTQTNAMISLGWMMFRKGQNLEAEKVLNECLEVLAGKQVWTEQIFRVKSNLAHVYMNLERWDESIDLFRQVLAFFDLHGRRGDAARMLNGLGEVYRMRGEIGAAWVEYERALALFKKIGSGQTFIVEMNLGHLLLTEGRFEEAESHLLEILELLHERGRRDYLGAVHARLMHCVAARRDWARWGQHLEIARSLFEETGAADADDALAVERSASLAIEAGGEGGEVALRLAMEMWTSIGDEASMLRARGLLGAGA